MGWDFDFLIHLEAVWWSHYIFIEAAAKPFSPLSILTRGEGKAHYSLAREGGSEAYCPESSSSYKP